MKVVLLVDEIDELYRLINDVFTFLFRNNNSWIQFRDCNSLEHIQGICGDNIIIYVIGTPSDAVAEYLSEVNGHDNTTVIYNC